MQSFKDLTNFVQKIPWGSKRKTGLCPPKDAHVTFDSFFSRRLWDDGKMLRKWDYISHTGTGGSQSMETLVSFFVQDFWSTLNLVNLNFFLDARGNPGSVTFPGRETLQILKKKKIGI